jgi:hypothetical protein
VGRREEPGPPSPTPDLICSEGWTADGPSACVRESPAARCETIVAVVAASAPMSLVDRVGLQIRPLRDAFDLVASAALDRNGRKGVEVRGARGGRWVRWQAFDRASGMTIARCEGDGAIDAADAVDVGDALSSVALGDPPVAEADPTAPAWLPAAAGDPLGPARAIGAGFTAGWPETWPDGADADGGTYQVACMQLHEAPTVAELLDRHSSITADRSLELGAARIGPRTGSVMRAVASIATSTSPAPRRGKAPVVRLESSLAGVFRFVWSEGADRCVLRYQTRPGAATPPEAFDRLGARLPEVVRVVATLSRH